MRNPFSNKEEKGAEKALKALRREQEKGNDLQRLAQWHAQRRDNPRVRDEKRLLAFEHQTFSQHGEDGIIAEIFRRVGTTNRFFVEFGAGDGLENNTAALFARGFTGAWIEGGVENVARVRENCAPVLKDGRLKLRQSFITAENIEALFADLAVPAKFDFLSIDIDGNDYWVWKAIARFVPRVVAIEYNAAWASDVSWVMRYDPGHVWKGGTHFGASLLALEKLGAGKGYALVGCDFSGVNAFFVQRELAEGKFAGPFTAANHFEPARYHLTHRAGHPAAFGDFVSE